MAEIINLKEAQETLAERAKFCKDIIMLSGSIKGGVVLGQDPLTAACKHYLTYQNETAWQLVEVAHKAMMAVK